MEENPEPIIAIFLLIALQRYHKKGGQKLNLNKEIPLIEIIEIKKNKSFVAKKQKYSLRKKNFQLMLQLPQYKSQIFQKIKTKKKLLKRGLKIFIF